MAEDTSIFTTPSPGVKVGRLTSIRAVRRELAKLYVDARTGNAVSASTAAKLAYVLTCVHKVLEVEVVESRLAALETKLQETKRA